MEKSKIVTVLRRLNYLLEKRISKKADNRVVSLSRIGWLNFGDQFWYFNC